VISLGSSSQFGTTVFSASASFAEIEQDAIVVYNIYELILRVHLFIHTLNVNYKSFKSEIILVSFQ
jgi:hypothetical protein